MSRVEPGGAIAAQQGGPVGARLGRQHGKWQGCGAVRQGIEQTRLPQQRLDREVARQRHAAHDRVDVCGQGGECAQAIELACDVGVGGVRHRMHLRIGK
jgi:hypothetical protein